MDIPNAVSLALWKSKPINVPMHQFMGALLSGKNDESKELERTRLKCARLQAELTKMKRNQNSDENIWSDDMDEDINDTELSDDVIISILRHSKDSLNLKPILLDKVNHPSYLSIRSLIDHCQLSTDDISDYSKIFVTTLQNALQVGNTDTFVMISKCMRDFFKSISAMNAFHVIIMYLFISKCTEALTKQHIHLDIIEIKSYNEIQRSISIISHELYLLFLNVDLSELIKIEYNGCFNLI